MVLKRIKVAIQNTINKYGKKHGSDAIYDIMKTGNTKRFTRDGNCRQALEETKNVQYEFLKEYVQTLTDNVPAVPTYFEHAVLRTYQNFEKSSNRETAIDTMAENLVNLFYGVDNDNTFTRDDNARLDYLEYAKQLQEKFGYNVIDTNITEVANFLANKTKTNEKNIAGKASKIRVKENYLNEYVYHILDERFDRNTDLKMIPQDSRNIGNTLFISQALGKRKNQEDSCMIIQNSEHPELSMMCVADGMGGSALGQEASKYITTNILKWYKELGNYSTRDPKTVKALESEIEKLNYEIYKKYNEGKSFREGAGSTLRIALFDNNGALVSNVGDSKAYITKGGVLYEVGENLSNDPTQKKGDKVGEGKGADSFVDGLYKLDEYDKYGLTEHDMRFHYDSNKITKFMGQEERVNPYTYKLDSDDYTKMFIMSDGVSDAMSLEQMGIVARETDKNLLAKTFVEASMYHDSHWPARMHRLPSEKQEEFRNVIRAGHDNSSVAVKINKNKDREER